MFANGLDTITTKSIKATDFIFEAIRGFVFRTIISFVFNIIADFIFGIIAGFVFIAINLLRNHGKKYLLQIKVKLKKTIIYLNRNYLYCAYLY